MSPVQVRTPEELKAARHALGLSAEGLARMVRVESGRTVRRWEAGDREIPGPVTAVMEIAMVFLRQKEEIDQQLERLKSGEMRSSMSWGNQMIDNTSGSITRLSDAKASLESALAILTKQMPNEQPAAQ